MDAVVFGLKRGFHATLRMVRPVLAGVGVGLTPARFDVLYALAQEREVTQMALRRKLGVARATMCEMLGELERRGWIARRRALDRRTHYVSLTPAGREVLERGYDAGIRSGTAPLAIDAALAQGDVEIDPFERREDLDGLCGMVRSFFGDTAVRDLYPWHPDEYLSELECLLPLDGTPGAPGFEREEEALHGGL